MSKHISQIFGELNFILVPISIFFKALPVNNYTHICKKKQITVLLLLPIGVQSQSGVRTLCYLFAEVKVECRVKFSLVVLHVHNNL